MIGPFATTPVMSKVSVAPLFSVRAEAVVILAPAPMEMLPRVMAFAFVNASVPAWTFVKPV